MEIRESIWWNHDAYFIVINTDIDNGCKMFDEFLKVIWSVNVLLVLYLCTNRKNGNLLYTFNPYADLAPNSWTKIPGIDTNWTMFRLSLQYRFDLSKIIKNSNPLIT